MDGCTEVRIDASITVIDTSHFSRGSALISRGVQKLIIPDHVTRILPYSLDGVGASYVWTVELPCRAKDCRGLTGLDSYGYDPGMSHCWAPAFGIYTRPASTTFTYRC